MMISTIAFGFGAPGLQAANFLSPLRRPRPPRRLLHPRLGPRVRPVRDRGRRRRRRRHRDHRRPRRPQDPRGARRAAGARRRPDQEPRRPALPGADADHRPDGHLRAALRHRRRHLRRDRLRPAARRVLRDPLQQRLGHRPLGIDPQVHDVRRDHRHRLLLQGDECVRRRRGSGPSRQRGGRDRLPGRLLRSTTSSPRPCSPPTPRSQVIKYERADGLARGTHGTGSVASATSLASRAGHGASSTRAASSTSSARRCARPGS